MRHFYLALTSVLGVWWWSASHADFRDPAAESFTVWPNIPFVRASDFEEYGLDRKIFRALHEQEADPPTMIAALQAVDQLQQHHNQRSLDELGRSINAELIGQLDSLVRAANLPFRKLKFTFAGISPNEIQRPLEMDEPELDRLEMDIAAITLVAYATYTQLPNNDLSVTLTLVKLRTGESESFPVVANVGRVSEKLAKVLFDYFHGNRFPQHESKRSNGQWLAPAPGHQQLGVPYLTAKNYCESQGARLPSVQELQAGIAAGPYYGGIRIKPDEFYHLREGIYATSYVSDPRGHLRPRNDLYSMRALYYCVRAN